MNKKDIAKELSVQYDTLRYWCERVERQLRKYIAEGGELSDNESEIGDNAEQKVEEAIYDLQEFKKEHGENIWV